MPKRDTEREKETEFRREVGRRIQMALFDKGLRQRDLAEAMGVEDSVISQWVNGRCGLSLYRLAKVAEITGSEVFPGPLNGRRDPARELGEALLKAGGPAARRLLDVPEEQLGQWIKLVLTMHRAYIAHAEQESRPPELADTPSN
jgi:transcriptional regulator with XRE-family HTH domain